MNRYRSLYKFSYSNLRWTGYKYGTVYVPRQLKVSLDVKEKTWVWAYQGADGARLSLQEEAGEVEHKDHHMVVQQRGIHLRNVKQSIS